MSLVEHIAQPASRTTLEALQRILLAGPVESIDVAVAYITSSGTFDLLNGVTGTLGAAWHGIPKRWITSFDYCRTEPVALAQLLSVPNSLVRIHDADFCLAHGGAPKLPFHPKTFLVRANQRDYALAGSGNMSRSGLSRGIEAGLVVGVDRQGPDEPTATAAMASIRTWYAAIWNAAKPLTANLLENYDRIFESKENLRSPVPTEDDVASGDTLRGALSTKDLQKLRICRSLWIEAGNITRNLGPTRPGNQLMMKRLSRVFFGFSPTTVPENTQIGNVELRSSGGHAAQYSLTFSDNKMDKLTLPIPGDGGPPAYDNRSLLFRRIEPGVFQLTLGNNTDKANWRNKSRAIDGAFRFSSGREWGVF